MIPFIALNLIVSLSLEVYGLYHIFGISPYLLIGALIAPFKVIYRNKKSLILYAITLFFALQLPLLPLIESNKIKDSQAYLEDLINKKNLLTEQNKNLLKNGGYGIYKYNQTEINNLDSKIDQVKNNSIEVNFYKSFVEVLIIFLVEYMLYFQLINFIKKPKAKTTKKLNLTKVRI